MQNNFCYYYHCFFLAAFFGESAGARRGGGEGRKGELDEGEGGERGGGGTKRKGKGVRLKEVRNVYGVYLKNLGWGGCVGDGGWVDCSLYCVFRGGGGGGGGSEVKGE